VKIPIIAADQRRVQFPFWQATCDKKIKEHEMKTRRRVSRILFLPIAGVLLLSTLLTAEPQRGMGGGMGGMRGMGGDHREDMRTIHSLFADREKIERKIAKLDDGVETVTESDDPDVAGRIVEHTYAMKERLERNRPIHTWDPLFAEIFANASKIRMEIMKTGRGVRVRETSADPDVVKLIQAHAEVVSQFISTGMPEMHKRHEVR
jgi:hypothetical protein